MLLVSYFLNEITITNTSDLNISDAFFPKRFLSLTMKPHFYWFIICTHNCGSNNIYTFCVRSATRSVLHTTVCSAVLWFILLDVAVVVYGQMEQFKKYKPLLCHSVDFLFIRLYVCMYVCVFVLF